MTKHIIMPNDYNEDLDLDLEVEEDLDLDTGDKEPEQKQVDWKTTAMRYKKQAQTLKQQLGTKQPSNKSTQKDSTDFEKKLARLELKTEGYSDTEIDFLEPYGGKQALENPHVKAAVDSIREQRKAEAAVITGDANKSDVERTFSPQEISSMSFEELDKALRSPKK